MKRAAPVLVFLAGCYGAGAYPGGGVDLGGGAGDDGPRVDFGGDADADSDADEGGGGGDVGGGDDDPADWLCTPCTRQGMCGSADNACVRNGGTNEQFCTLACDRGSCPTGYYCQDLGGGFPTQCLPEGDSCVDGGGDDGGDAGGDDPIDDGGGLGGGDGGGDGAYGADVQHCLEVTNAYRAQHGLGALTIDDAVQQCAQEGAEADSRTGMAHGHFSQTGGCGVAWAENEIPGWPLQGSVTAVIDGGLEMMMDEGPGGGHYENILGDWTSMGCGVYVTGGGEVWVVQDFR